MILEQITPLSRFFLVNQKRKFDSRTNGCNEPIFFSEPKLHRAAVPVWFVSQTNDPDPEPVISVVSHKIGLV